MVGLRWQCTEVARVHTCKSAGVCESALAARAYNGTFFILQHLPRNMQPMDEGVLVGRHTEKTLEASLQDATGDTQVASDFSCGESPVTLAGNQLQRIIDKPLFGCWLHHGIHWWKTRVHDPTECGE